MTTYQLVDEPRPSSISHLTVDPMWPLLGYMLGSPFFSWIWSALNSHALGSPTKRKELAIIMVGVVGFFIWVIIVTGLNNSGTVDGQYLPYLRLVLTIFTLMISYALYVLQNRPFEIYEHFGGKVMTGIPGLLLAIYLGNSVQKYIITTVLKVLL